MSEEKKVLDLRGLTKAEDVTSDNLIEQFVELRNRFLPIGLEYNSIGQPGRPNEDPYKLYFWFVDEYRKAAQQNGVEILEDEDD